MDTPGREVTTTVTRNYTNGARTFEVLLSRRVLKGTPFWTVERVMDHDRDRFVVIPGMQSVTASTPDVTFACACDCIDKWLWASRDE